MADITVPDNRFNGYFPGRPKHGHQGCWNEKNGFVQCEGCGREFLDCRDFRNRLGLDMRYQSLLPEEPELIEIRKEVVLFALDMEKILKKHDPEKGESWKTKDYWTLIDMLEKQHSDFVWLSSHEKYYEAKEKLLDIANACMMLYQFYLKHGLGDCDSVPSAGLPGLKDQDRNEPDPYLDVHGGLD